VGRPRCLHVVGLKVPIAPGKTKKKKKNQRWVSESETPSKNENTCLCRVHECADEAYQGHGGLEHAKNSIIDRRKGGARVGHSVLWGRVQTRTLFKDEIHT